MLQSTSQKMLICNHSKLHGIDGKSDSQFLFFFLLHPEVRADLASKMEGSTIVGLFAFMLFAYGKADEVVLLFKALWQ